MDSSIKCNFSMLVVGPSGSGKTIFTHKLLYYRAQIMSKCPSKIIWCYSIWQPFYDRVKETISGVTFMEGIPDIDLIKSGNFILVVDDLMDSPQTAVLMSDIFTKYSHHYNISCIFILQNLFPKFKQARTISLNASYIVLMKNIRDKGQISHLASQVFPGSTKFLIDAFADATKDPYSYLFLDFKPHTPDEIRIRTNIFPSDTNVIVYEKV